GAGPDAREVRRRIPTTVIVAGMFLPPTLNTPTVGDGPRTVAPPSPDSPFPSRTVMPAYPPLARSGGVGLLALQIDRAGHVAGAEGTSPAPPFDRVALEAARQWSFRPAQLHGVAVPSYVYVAFGFPEPVTTGRRQGAP